MQWRVIPWVMVGMGLSLAGVRAQTGPLETTEDVLAAFRGANGGEERIERVVSIRASGHLERGDGWTCDLLLLRKAPGMKRLSLTLPDRAEHRGFDGDAAWRAVQWPDGRWEVELLEGAEKTSFEAAPFHLDPLFFPAAAGLSHLLEGTAYVDRAPTYVLRSVGPGLHRRAYVDMRSWRILRVEELSAEGSRVEAEQRLGDYVRIGGLWMARHVVRTTPEGEQMTVRFDEIAINEGIFDEIFAPPAGS